MKRFIAIIGIILGVISGLWIIWLAFRGLSTFIFLVHPVGDTLMGITWGYWVISFIFTIIILVSGILVCFDSFRAYLSRPIKSLKSSRRLIYLGLLFLVFNLGSVLEFVIRYKNFVLPNISSKSILPASLKMFIMNPLFIPGLITLFIGLIALKNNKLKYKESIDTNVVIRK